MLTRSPGSGLAAGACASKVAGPLKGESPLWAAPGCGLQDWLVIFFYVLFCFLKVFLYLDHF